MDENKAFLLQKLAVAMSLEIGEFGRVTRHEPLNLRLQVAHRLLLDPPRLLVDPLLLPYLGARLIQRLHPSQLGRVPLLGVPQTLLGPDSIGTVLT